MPHPLAKTLLNPVRRLAGRIIWNIDSAVFRHREAARKGQAVPPDFPEETLPDHRPVGPIALVGIAKNEDNYIDEWIDYHLRLGVSRVFLYENNWRARLKRPDSRVTLIPLDGVSRQMAAYRDFLHNRSKGFDFGIFIDIDEFVCLPRHDTLADFLDPFLAYRAIGLNWRLFGDSGHKGVENGDYSLVDRFVRCDRSFHRCVKTILNLRHWTPEVFFTHPHSVKIKRFFSPPGPLAELFGRQDLLVTPDRLHRIFGPYNDHFPDPPAWLNHYKAKTLQEFLENRAPKGGGHSIYPYAVKPLSHFHDDNRNDVENLAAKTFYDRSRRLFPDAPPAS